MGDEMGIREDAGELLLYIYIKKRKEGRVPNLDELLQVTKWEPMRLAQALDYCGEKYFLNIRKFLGSYKPGLQQQIIADITSSGIDIVEAARGGNMGSQFNVVFNLNININNPTIELTFGKFALV